MPEKNRWKVGCLNKTIAREMEAAIKTRLLLGHEKTEQAKPILFKEWATAYLNLESIKTLRSYQDRLQIMERQSIHDLRHCASTNLRRAGVDTATAMKIVGHKSEKMWKRYNAIEERDLVQAALKV